VPIKLSAEVLPALRAALDELSRLSGRLPPDGTEPARREGWSAREILGHMADFELVAAVRVLAVLSLERPALARYGQEELTRRFAATESAADAFQRFAAVRRSTLRLLERLQPDDWERIGIHHQRGAETLRRTVEMIARHDRGHLEQMRAALGRE
jgi:hypothetical protein